MRFALRVALCAAASGTLLVACGAGAPPALYENGDPRGATEREQAPVAAPTAITIPALDAHSTLTPLGLAADGALQVPPVTRPMQAGYYAGADPAFAGDEVLPGEVGSAVVVGHVDGVVDGQKGHPGIFAHLAELAPGDEVLVDREDGSRVRFVVERVEQHAKDAFPTAEFYTLDDQPRLNLATCGGAFDDSIGHYDDNILVWAVLAS